MPSIRFRFVPSTGRIAAWLMPGGPGIRVDSHCGSGVVIRQGHPNLLGNLTAAGRDRAQAIARMRVALGEAAIEGVRTNLRLHQGIMEDDSYRRGGVYVGYLDEQIARRYRPGRSPRRT
ncbi:MAG: hypothetical protein IPG84_03735 [Betaproteobacteria bacterium]|nr:hypothetical protein [Betaproteobacteria bacterium]